MIVQTVIDNKYKKKRIISVSKNNFLKITSIPASSVWWNKENISVTWPKKKKMTHVHWMTASIMFNGKPFGNSPLKSWEKTKKTATIIVFAFSPEVLPKSPGKRMK